MNTLIVERQKIKHNLALTRKQAGGAALIGVLSCDAFGFGLTEMARVLRDEGVARFAVDTPYDGAALRRSGFPDEEILVLHSTTAPRDIECLLENGLTATVASSEAAQALSALAERRHTVALAHILIHTGSGSSGFLPHEFDKITAIYQYMNALGISGVYTHLAAHRGKKVMQAQLETFRGLLTRMRGQGLELGLLHAADSAALFSSEIQKLDAVRADLSVTGHMPGRTGLQRVGLVQTYIESVQWLPKGVSIGFQKNTVLRRPRRVGLLPIGLSDGFGVTEPFPTGSGGWFRRRARRVNPVVYAAKGKLNVLGDIGLNQTAVDLTDLKWGVNDEVVVEVFPLWAGTLAKRYI